MKRGEVYSAQCIMCDAPMLQCSNVPLLGRSSFTGIEHYRIHPDGWFDASLMPPQQKPSETVSCGRPDTSCNIVDTSGVCEGTWDIVPGTRKSFFAPVLRKTYPFVRP